MGATNRVRRHADRRLLVVLVSWLWTSNGLAQPAPGAATADGQGVTTTVDPCVQLDAAQFHRLLSIELGTSIAYRAGDGPGPGETWVHLSCAGRGIELRLEDGVTRKTMIRVLDSATIEPSSRARLLALAVAEFVVASWVELRVVPRPAVSPVGPAPPPSAAKRAARALERHSAAGSAELGARRARSWELGLGVGVEAFFSHLTMMPTLSLRLVQHAADHVALTIGADVGLVSVRAIGDPVSVGTIDLIRASGLAALTFGAGLGDTDLFAGPGVRFGVIHMQGDSELPSLRGKSFYEPLGGICLLARVGQRFGELVRLGIELEAGAITMPAQALVQERVVLDLKDVWLSASLRASLLF